MSGWVESHMKERVTVAYTKVLDRFPEVASLPGLTLVAAPESVMSHGFTPRMRLISHQLRQLFSGEDGRRLTVVLGFLKEHHFVVEQREEKAGLVQYGIDSHGPYRLVLPKKRPFQRRSPPVTTRISFEEICFFTENPNKVYLTVYQLMSTAVTSILEGE